MTDAAGRLDDLPDEELMLLVARGFVREPATELFRRHNRGLFNYLAWLSGGDRREAEDIAQATWVRVMSRCGDYQPQAAFSTCWRLMSFWLLASAAGVHLPIDLK